MVSTSSAQNYNRNKHTAAGDQALGDTDVEDKLLPILFFPANHNRKGKEFH